MLRDEAFLFIDQPCTTGAAAVQAFGRSVKFQEQNRTYTFVGTGNTSQCQSLIERVMNISNCIVEDFCEGDTGSYSVPPVNGEYLVMKLTGL